MCSGVSSYSQKNQNKGSVLLVVKRTRRASSRAQSDRIVTSSQDNNVKKIEVKKFHGCTMNQNLTNNNFKFDASVDPKETTNMRGDGDVRNFVQVEMRGRKEGFFSRPEKKRVTIKKFTEREVFVMPETSQPHEKLFRACSD